MGKGELTAWFSCALSDNDSVHDLGIENQNRIIMSKAKEIVVDCKTLGLSFKKSEDVVLEKICDLIKGA